MVRDIFDRKDQVLWLSKRCVFFGFGRCGLFLFLGRDGTGIWTIQFTGMFLWDVWF